jgi:CBS domain-containing protein
VITIENYFVRSNLATIEMGSSLAEAARRMLDLGIGSLITYNKDSSNYIGLITDNHIINALAAGRDLNKTPCMHFHMVAIPGVSVETTPQRCAELMRDYHTRHLIVTERGAMIGVISLLDLFHMVTEAQDQRITELVNHISGQENA